MKLNIFTLWIIGTGSLNFNKIINIALNFLKCFTFLIIIQNANAQSSSDVPQNILAPVIGSISYNYPNTNCPWPTSTKWGFCQHQSGYHSSTGGIQGASDIYAFDCNQANDLDNGENIYPVEDGYITNILGWGGSSAGQLLIRHTSNGKTWYSGYLHMKNITSKKYSPGSFVSKNEVIGNVGNVGANNNHLHFAVYYLSNNKLYSVNRAFIERGATNSQSISVSNPNGGIYYPGQQISISYSSTGGSSSIALELMPASGGSSIDVIANVIPANGTRNYNLPTNLSNGQYKIKAYVVGTTGQPFYSNAFTVTRQSISFSNPNGGSYNIGSNMSISYSSTNGSNNVALELVKCNSSSQIDPIRSSASYSGSFNYTIPQVSSGSYRIKGYVVGSSGQAYYSNCFTINEAVPPASTPTLIAPSNGAQNLTSPVSFSWNSPNSNEYRIQIIEAGDFSNFSTSSGFSSNCYKCKVDQGSLSSQSYTWSDGQAGKTYYWTIRANGPGGPSSFANYRSFKMKPASVSPPSISASSTNICSGSSSVLTAAGCSGTVNWNNGLGSGSSKTVYPTSTTTYSATCTIGGVTSGNSNSLTIIVNAIPSAPSLSASPSTITSGSSSTLTASGCNGTVNWSNGLGSGSSKTVYPTSTTTYTATCTVNGCISNSSSVPLIVNASVSPPSISASSTNICSGSSSVLTASGCSGTVTWNNGLGSGTSKTVNPTSTTTYSATCTVGGVTSGNSNSLTITVKAKPSAPSLSASPSTITSGNSSTLTASGCSGTVNWSNGLGSGSSKTIYPTSTTTYTATCTENGCTSNNSSITVTVKAPTCSDPYEANNSYSSATLINSNNWVSDVACIFPSSDKDYFKWVYNSKTYYIRVESYWGEETGKYRLSLSLNGSLLTIKTQTAGNDDVDTYLYLYDSDGTTILVENDDGNGNLYSKIEYQLCNLSAPSLTATSSIINTGQSSTLTGWGCSGEVHWNNGLGVGASKSVSPTSTTTYSATCVAGGCTSESSSITITVIEPSCNDPYEANNTYSSATLINSNNWLSDVACIFPSSDKDYFKWVYNSKTYYIRVESFWGEDTGKYRLSLSLNGSVLTIKTQSAGNDNVDTYIYLYDSDGTTILKENDDGNGNLYSKIEYQLCNLSTPLSSNVSRCGAGQVTLSASGCSSQYAWYASASGGAPIGTSSSLTLSNVSQSTTYYVSCKAGSCESNRKAVQVTINAVPNPPNVSPVTIVHNTKATLTATSCSATVKWYSSASGGSAIASGSAYTTPNLTATTTYYASCATSTCESSRQAVTVTVIPPCSKPDLTVTNIQVTKYTSDKVYYRVTIKNIGNQAADMGSFGFATYGSATGVLNSSATFKHTMFMGGGSLAPNKTINYDTYISINYNNNQHYLIVEADNNNMISECDESNNVMSVLIKPCTSNGNLTLSGSQTGGFIGSNGKITIKNNASFAKNTVVAGKAIEGMPTFNATATNVNFLIGKCANVSTGTTNNGIPISDRPSPVTGVKFNENIIEYSLTDDIPLNVSIWDAQNNLIVKDLGKNKRVGAGNQSIQLDSISTDRGYVIRIETKDGFYFKRLENSQ